MVGDRAEVPLCSFPQKTGLLTKRQSSELAGYMPVLFSKPLEAALISQELETAWSSEVLFSSQLMGAGSGSTQGPPYLILDPLILSCWLGETNRITRRALKCFSGSTIFLSCRNYAKTTGETIKLIFFFFFKHQVTDSSLSNIKLEGSWDHLTITWHFQSSRKLGSGQEGRSDEVTCCQHTCSLLLFCTCFLLGVLPQLENKMAYS